MTDTSCTLKKNRLILCDLLKAFRSFCRLYCRPIWVLEYIWCCVNAYTLWAIKSCHFYWQQLRRFWVDFYTFCTSGNRNEYSTSFLLSGLMTSEMRHTAHHKILLHGVTFQVLNTNYASFEDKTLIKNLLKGRFLARRLIKEFPNKNSKNWNTGRLSAKVANKTCFDRT